MSKKVKHKRHCINTRHAPQAIGPYNQAVLIDGTLYISGQLGIDPGTMELVEGGVEEEAIQALKNMYHILKRANCEFSDVVKTTILLKDMNDFQTVNAVYEQCFKNPLGFNELPARMAFQVAALPKNGLVEIEAVAKIGAQSAGSIYALAHDEDMD